MSCSYETHCSKGPDRGFATAVKPYLCTGCNEVKNCIVGKSENRGGPINIALEPVCPLCKKGDHLINWDLLTCPKCGRSDMHYHYLSTPWD